jgi:TRAP-type C4-dicarboxylate transport system substrate-binding protein
MRACLGCLLLVLIGGTALAADDEPVTLRLGTLAIEGSRYMKDITALSEDIAKKTRGRVRLDWASDGRLGDERAMADLVARGKLDGGGFSETALIAMVPEMAVWQYPGLFQTYDELDRATSALDATVRELHAKRDLVFVMWADLGFAHVFSTERVTTVRDVVAKGAPWLTVPLDAKLFDAIAGGKAQEWALPPLYMLATGLTTQAKHMWQLRYRYVVGGLVIARAAWSRLTAAQQQIVLDVCRTWQPKLRASWRKESERGIAALRKAGLSIDSAVDAEVTAFVAGAATSRTAHAKQAGLADLVDKIVAATPAR